MADGVRREVIAGVGTNVLARENRPRQFWGVRSR